MEALTALLSTALTGYSPVESVLSDDGKALYLYMLASSGHLTDKEIIYEKWKLKPAAPELSTRTICHLSTAEIRLRQIRDFAKPALQLVPSKPISAPPNLSDLLHTVQIEHQGLLGSKPEGEAQNERTKLLNEYWGCVSRRDNFLILCRRKRLVPSSEDDSIANERRDWEARLERRIGRVRPGKAYDDQLDFDEISGSEDSSQESDSELEASGKGVSNPDSGDLEPPLSESDQASDQEDTQSLRGTGSNETRFSGSWESSSSSGSIASSSSSSSRWSITSNERLRTQEYLNSSGNSWHHREIIELQQWKECDACSRQTFRWLHCFDCVNSDYDVCLSCIDKGRWCLDTSHEMLEADGKGPIIMRRFSEWVFTNEIRVYDVNDDGTKDCIFEFSAEREDLLHESQPALHPSAPIIAWPLSPTKLVLASFTGDKERVIQRMRPFARHGRKIDVQVRFSDSGSHLLVASIEAVKVMCQARETYNLHMQVAVLDLRFDGENLTKPAAICERHHNLRVNLPSTSETLPFAWSWSSNEVCLALTTDKISLWRVKLNPSGPEQLYLGLVEASTAQRPSQYDGGPPKAHLIYSNEANVPVVALAPVHLRSQAESSSICYIKADNPWSACDNEDDTRHKNAEVHPKTHFRGSERYQAYGTAQFESADAPKSTSTTQLSQTRSEIRLLYLLPGSAEDTLRCRLTKVSLDDLQDSKSKLMERYLGRDEGENPETSHADTVKAKKQDALGPDTESRELARVDYLKPEDANVKLMELISKVASPNQTLPKSLTSIPFRGATGKTVAIAARIMEQRKQNRTRPFKNGLHPKYNYEALSYVWGKSVGKHTVTLDGKKGVLVTDNLYAALRRLRRPHSQRVFWIDALCIDQTNVKERSWQVQMMGRIYSTAARVVVWLGDGEAPPSTLHHDSSGAKDKPEGLDDTESSSSDSSGSDAISQWQKGTLEQVLESASPPWWTRAWVTQELVQAEDVHVAFGAVEVDWPAFKSGMWGVWSSFSEFKQLIELRTNRKTWHYKGSIGETALLARHTNATDDRDKVYSLLSLIKPGQESLIRPDYSLQPAEVFIQATYADLWDNVYGADIYEESPDKLDKKYGFCPDVQRYPASSSSNHLVQTGLRPDRFRVLNWAKPDAPHRQGLPGMPSWAVDFSDPSALTGDAEFRYGFERWTFGGNNDLSERAMLKLFEDSRQLTVRGAVLGRIKDIVQEYPVREYRNRPAEEVVARLLTLISSLPSRNPYEVVTGSHAKLRTDDLRAIRTPNWILKEPIIEPGAFFIEHEEVVTRILPHWDPTAEHDTVDWTDLYSMALNRGDCEVQGCRCGPSQFFRSWDTCVGVPHHARNFSDNDSKKTSPWDNYCELFEADLDPAKANDPLEEEQSRFLLTTSPGFIGLGPEGAEPGDVIALFYGSDIPVVLRAQGDHFVYRGRAWINGIMRGELWNIYEDPLLEERDFIIS